MSDSIKWDLCFYHSADLDGICSGAIVKKAFPDIELHGYDYGDKFPMAKVAGKNVIMVDVSLPSTEMVVLGSMAENFLWIDHHDTALKTAEEFDWSTVMDIYGRVANPDGKKVAACELAWERLIGGPLPAIVHHLSRHDVWDHSDPMTWPIQYAAQAHCKGPDDGTFWNALLDDDVPGQDDLILMLVNLGHGIQKYLDQTNTRVAGQHAFTVELDGYKFIVLNTPHRGSQNLGKFDAQDNRDGEFDGGAVYCQLPDGRWRHSLYAFNDDIHVGEIAKRRGGGGHKGAAGFITKTPAFSPVPKL